MFWKILLLALFLATPALADTGLPPPRYDHPYKGKLRIIYTSSEGVRLACRAPPGLIYYGCTAMGRRSCTIWLSTNDPTILRHEIGHCNGWPPDHRR